MPLNASCLQGTTLLSLDVLALNQSSCCFSFLSTSADAGVLIRQLRTDSFVIKLLQHCLVECMKIHWNVEVIRLTVTLNRLQTSHCGELAAFVSVDEQDCNTTLLAVSLR